LGNLRRNDKEELGFLEFSIFYILYMQLKLFEKPEGIIYYHTNALLYFRVYPPLLCLFGREESQKSENHQS